MNRQFLDAQIILTIYTPISKSTVIIQRLFITHGTVTCYIPKIFRKEKIVSMAGYRQSLTLLQLRNLNSVLSPSATQTSSPPE